MAKIQLMVFLSLDGCLLERQSLSALQDSADKYGITRIRKKAVRHLEEPVSFVSLSRWKEEGDGIALVEASPDTLPLVDSLLRFWMVDEMVIYLSPRLQGGIRTVRRRSCAFRLEIDRKQTFRYGCLPSGLFTYRILNGDCGRIFLIAYPEPRPVHFLADNSSLNYRQ